MPPVGFEPTISAGERPQTYALDRAATGTVIVPVWHIKRTDSSCNCRLTVGIILNFRNVPGKYKVW